MLYHHVFNFCPCICILNDSQVTDSKLLRVMTEQNVPGHAQSDLCFQTQVMELMLLLQQKTILGLDCYFWEWKVARLGQKQTKTCCCKNTRCSFRLC